jgi:2-polyprenyl-6-hydroxyphenyl methylase/3-demethylubiquinone-9 3-methyltransferase
MPCKVCNGTAELFGVVDFNKNCLEEQGVLLALTGVPIWYHRCTTCGLIFTAAFDHWPPHYFAEHIYNEDYVKVDPDFRERRAVSNTRLVANFIRRGEGLRLLDYGGGNGTLANLLRSQGVDAASWDANTDSVRPSQAAFDVVTSFEVFEHTTDPVTTCAEALSCLKPGGVLFFSTLTVDTLPPRAVHFWYIAPRNGHITIHTTTSLTRLFERFGYRLHHHNNLLHLAFRALPDWLR